MVDNRKLMVNKVHLKETGFISGLPHASVLELVWSEMFVFLQIIGRATKECIYRWSRENKASPKKAWNVFKYLAAKIQCKKKGTKLSVWSTEIQGGST